MNSAPMSSPAPEPSLPITLDRRRLLQAAALVGGAAALSGCAGRATYALPGPVWPKEQPTTPAQPIATIAIPEPSIPVSPLPRHAPPAVVVNNDIPVLPRSMWTRAEPKWNVSRPMNGVNMITVHHDALNAQGLRGQNAAAERLSHIRTSHMSRGSTWVDIGYHFIIDPDGRVWEGRPERIEGAHVASTNDHNLGIMLMGNFEEHRPTQAQLNILDQFVAQQMGRFRVPMNRLYTHRELKPTECPGRNLQMYMRQTRASGGRLAQMA